MGLKWVRLETGWPTNPKVAMLVGSGLRGKSAAYAYAAGLCYSGQHGLDGFVPRYALALVNISAKDVALLVEHELWHEDGDGGWRINDWSEYQESNEETQKRSDKARKAAQRRWSSESTRRR